MIKIRIEYKLILFESLSWMSLVKQIFLIFKVKKENKTIKFKES